MKTEELLLYKSVQGKEFYCEDYISGPMHRNKELNLALHEKSRWCYHNKCKNNIYDKTPVNDSDLNFSKIINKYIRSKL